MEEIVTIHSIVHKKQKNIVKPKTIQSIPLSSTKNLKEIEKHSSKFLIIENKIINNINQDINSSLRKNLSQEKLRKTISFIKKYDFDEISESLLDKKNANNKNHSEKELKNEEDANTPLMNLQRNKKPNYLMKSAFIKDKSLTPQEKSYQNSSCPIYDFYNLNSGFNTAKNDNLLQNTSFTQYYNNFKKINNPQVNDFFNPSPHTNLSDKNNMNRYYNYPFITTNENDKINEIDQDQSSSFDEKEKNNPIYNTEKDENLVDLKNEVQNVEGNTPSNLGGAFSPSFDFFDESIFGNDNNFHKSPINYKQMNVNININNNSQNNNIYYHLPNIINNFNNNCNNNYYNNNPNNKEINNNVNFGKYANFNENANQNNQITNNNIKQQNIENIKNIKNIKNNLQNNLNNNQMNLGNISNLNRGYNNQNNINMQRQINYNNQDEPQNFTSLYNKMNLNPNQINQMNQVNQMNQISKLNQNLANYLNQISTINNNMNMNDILNPNFNNNKINYNINYNNANKNNINNKNINFSSVANAYMNQNIINPNIYNNNNINPLQKEIPNQNNINNQMYNQSLQYYIYNKEKMAFQNNKMLNLNNNYPYMNNMNNLNNFNQNNMGIFNNQMNTNNIAQINNNQIPESIFYSLTPIQLAKQCHIIAKNQAGCRYLQNYIASNPQLFKNLFFPIILEHITELSNDQYSNYFIKKIFQYLSEDMLLKLIQTLLPLVEQIGTNQYGTRVLQDLIDFLKTEKTFLAFVNIIIPHVKLLIIDLNGSHIIYKLIITKNKSIKIIEEIICMQVKDIAITRKGCSFLKKYFDFQEENDLIKIKQCILQNLREIITDQYGNYVIQSILVKEGSPIVKDYINEIIKNIVFYSNNKFSSNAVEKCFENENMKNVVLDQFLQKDIFEKIILDKFGNYVVQKAISKADNNRRNYMLQLLIPLIPSLKSQYFGQRLLSKLISQYPNLNNSI